MTHMTERTHPYPQMFFLDLFPDFGLNAASLDCGRWWSMTTLWVIGMGKLARQVRRAQRGSLAGGPALNSPQSTVKFNPKFILQLNSNPNLCTASTPAPLKGG